MIIQELYNLWFIITMHNEDAGYDKVQSSRVLVEKDGSGNVHRRYQITQEGLKLSVGIFTICYTRMNIFANNVHIHIL